MSVIYNVEIVEYTYVPLQFSRLNGVKQEQFACKIVICTFDEFCNIRGEPFFLKTFFFFTRQR